MNEDKRADLLKDEYVILQHFYEDIDGKGLTILCDLVGRIE